MPRYEVMREPQNPLQILKKNKSKYLSIIIFLFFPLLPNLAKSYFEVLKSKSTISI
jgi:hypothetical protein